MVQEKVGSSSPSAPQTPISGGTIIPKLNNHTKAIISPIFGPNLFKLKFFEIFKLMV